MTAYQVSNQANRDLDDIEEEISNDNPAAAERVIEALFETFTSVARTPSAGQKRDDLMPGIRVFPGKRPANKYVVFYYETDVGIEISDVIHSARDWEELFARGERGGS